MAVTKRVTGCLLYQETGNNSRSCHPLDSTFLLVRKHCNISSSNWSSALTQSSLQPTSSPQLYHLPYSSHSSSFPYTLSLICNITITNQQPDHSQPHHQQWFQRPTMNLNLPETNKSILGFLSLCYTLYFFTWRVVTTKGQKHKTDYWPTLFNNSKFKFISFISVAPELLQLERKRRLGRSKNIFLEMKKVISKLCTIKIFVVKRNLKFFYYYYFF